MMTRERLILTRKNKFQAMTAVLSLFCTSQVFTLGNRDRIMDVVMVTFFLIGRQGWK